MANAQPMPGNLAVREKGQHGKGKPWAGRSADADWQWAVPITGIVNGETGESPLAFLWIPPDCKKVRGVVVGQHNMLEEGILEHPAFRSALSDIGFAEIWITPAPDMIFDFNKGAGDHFNDMMHLLAEASGYAGLVYAPVVPIGHSAAASYPWNFGAWNPARTLAILSVHGDAPLSNLTGSGRPNPDWGSRSIDGIPALMVMGEYEWWEDRLMPAFKYAASHPQAPISLLADAGHGHFDFSDELVRYLALFIRKAAETRLPKDIPADGPVDLRPVDPKTGWLADRWRREAPLTAEAAGYAAYKGDRTAAFWYFDKEMAEITEAYYARARGKKEQYVGIRQDGIAVKPTKNHAGIIAPFSPLEDGISFRLEAFFADSSKITPSIGHAHTPPVITRICGPVVKIDDSTFQLDFYRMGFNNAKRSNDIWMLASSPGDEQYKSAVQQFELRFPLWNKVGKEQHLAFPPLPDQRAGIREVPLLAVSDAGVPVHYYVRQGPAVIKNNSLIFTKIPPGAKFPLKVTVVAWQYGRSAEPSLQSAQPVEQSFYLIKK